MKADQVPLWWLPMKNSSVDGFVHVGVDYKGWISHLLFDRLLRVG